MKNTYDMVVMGDINLDWCSKGLLSFAFSELIVNGVIEWAPIDELPGGSGLNFARFAQELGYRPVLLGKIGDDTAGRFIYEWLRQRGLESGVTIDGSLSTGKAFIARDKNDIRFLVNNLPNANQALSILDIEQHGDIISSCKILYISGYCLMDPQAPRKEATLRAMKFAHSPKGEQKAHIVLDVVPHQIYKIYNFPEFLQLTNEVDILISEVATMRRYLNIGDRSERITRSMVSETVESLKGFYNCFVLRFGPSGCDEQVIWDEKKGILKWEETGHKDAEDKRGYGDKMAIRVLQNIFKITPISKT